MTQEPRLKNQGATPRKIGGGWPKSFELRGGRRTGALLRFAAVLPVGPGAREPIGAQERPSNPAVDLGLPKKTEGFRTAHTQTAMRFHRHGAQFREVFGDQAFRHCSWAREPFRPAEQGPPRWVRWPWWHAQKKNTKGQTKKRPSGPAGPRPGVRAGGVWPPAKKKKTRPLASALKKTEPAGKPETLTIEHVGGPGKKQGKKNGFLQQGLGDFSRPLGAAEDCRQPKNAKKSAGPLFFTAGPAEAATRPPFGGPDQNEAPLTGTLRP